MRDGRKSPAITLDTAVILVAVVVAKNVFPLIGRNATEPKQSWALRKGKKIILIFSVVISL